MSMVTEASFQSAVGRVRSRVLQVASVAWGALPSYRDSEIDRFIERVSPRIAAGQLQIANITASYLRDQLGVLAPVDRDMVTGGRGVPREEVYRRPAVAVYSALSDDVPMALAVEAGAARLASLVSMDMQMAKVRQADRSMSAGGVSSFRRVLTGQENCAMCMIASTQRYHVGTLLPIHPGCDCGVEPLADGGDEQVIDPDLLDQVHAAVEARTGAADRGGRAPDYRKMVAVREHGEYGPTLTWAEDKFTSSAEISALN